MFAKTITLQLGLVLFFVQNSEEFRFSRRVVAIGDPYYQILMALGTCKETLMYNDHKYWGKIVLNRIVDFYYKADNERYKISRAEIMIVINNTNCYAYSEEGVGNSEFAATVFLPAHLNYAFYMISIFSCYRESAEVVSMGQGDSDPLSHTYLPFLHSDQYNYHDTDKS
ncbi:hypothetical protein PYW08_007747 [Mythimna loreyi]|uniref:Uncharacterized protein n=1 Tax=Mythimna loreyi TaxID=667449 RepID=A0ACC2QCK0_9NEOP|nr:hypothetical protein PYW08_007747 [Mythimna loreyi]